MPHEALFSRLGAAYMNMMRAEGRKVGPNNVVCKTIPQLIRALKRGGAWLGFAEKFMVLEVRGKLYDPDGDIVIRQRLGKD